MKANSTRIGVTHGLRGWFALMYDDNGPITSGVGSYGSAEEAHEEAAGWAKLENLPCDPLPKPSNNPKPTSQPPPR